MNQDYHGHWRQRATRRRPSGPQSFCYRPDTLVLVRWGLCFVFFVGIVDFDGGGGVGNGKNAIRIHSNLRGSSHKSPKQRMNLSRS